MFSTPTIHVKLFATLLRYRPDLRHGQAVPLPLQAGETLGNAIERLGLPAEAVRHVFLNGRRAALDTVPHDGDEVAIFPPIAGG
jgi:molybdopterin converting factor small subunit